MITYIIGAVLSTLIWTVFIKYNFKKGWINWSLPTTIKALIVVGALSWVSIIFVLCAAIYVSLFSDRIKLPN